MLRRSPLRRKRTTPRRGPERDPAYLEFVRTQPCAARSAAVGWECRGPIHAHHAGARGLGQKCPDREAIPLCSRHHQEWHDGNGRFVGMGKAARRVFAAIAIDITQREHDGWATAIAAGPPF